MKKKLLTRTLKDNKKIGRNDVALPSRKEEDGGFHDPSKENVTMISVPHFDKIFSPIRPISRSFFWFPLLMALWFALSESETIPRSPSHSAWGQEKGEEDASPFGELSEDDGPFARSTKMTDEEKNSPAPVNRFFKTKKGEDVPLIDERGNLIFRRPQDKDPSEMTEEDFYKTITPAENVILAGNPTTGPALLEAAVRISRVGRPEFARLLAEKGLDAPGTPKEFAEVYDRLGEEKLIHFSMDERVGEIARTATDKIRTESKKEWEDPQYLRDALEALNSPSEETRGHGILNLRKGGVAAFDLLLKELDSDNQADRDRALNALPMIGTFASDGLLERIRVAPEAEKIRLAEVIVRIPRLSNLTPLLVLYYDGSGSPELHDALETGLLYYDRKVVFPNVANGKVFLWRTNGNESTEWVSVPVEEAYRVKAAEYLTDAFRLDPSNPKAVSAAIAAVSEDLIFRNGLDEEPDIDGFHKALPDLSPRQVEEGLAFVLRSGHLKGGILPVTILGESGETSLCYEEGKPSALIQAAVAKDRRLSFAALKAILKLNPSEPYVGSSAVTSALIDFTRSTGKRKGVIGVPQSELIPIVAQNLLGNDYQMVPAQTGGDIIREAQTDPDVEFVLGVSYLRNPDMRTVAQTLANDFRTTDIPVIIAYEDETRLHQAERYGFGEKNAYVYILPFDQASGEWEINDLFTRANPRQIPAELRLAHAKEAIGMLGRLRATNEGIYHIENLDELAVRFLVTPVTTWEGVDFAMTVPSNSVQNVLCELVFDNRFPLIDREKYLTVLKNHIDRFGLLLRGPDILRLFNGPWPGDSGEIRKDFFRLLSDHLPEGSDFALSVPSPHIQNLLGDLVGDCSVDLADRRQDLDLFAKHLKRFGILLERSDIKRLYDRYNASENEPKEDQAILSELLDEIEKAQIGKQMVD